MEEESDFAFILTSTLATRQILFVKTTDTPELVTGAYLITIGDNRNLLNAVFGILTKATPVQELTKVGPIPSMIIPAKDVKFAMGCPNSLAEELMSV